METMVTVLAYVNGKCAGTRVNTVVSLEEDGGKSAWFELRDELIENGFSDSDIERHRPATKKIRTTP
jgi:hypothetical protein